MLLTPVKGQKDLEKERASRLSEVVTYFKSHLKDKHLIFPEKEMIASDLKISFMIRRNLLQQLCIEVSIANNGGISGTCYRQGLYKHDNSNLHRFYNFNVTTEEELKRECTVLNFLLKTF